MKPSWMKPSWKIIRGGFTPLNVAKLYVINDRAEATGVARYLGELDPHSKIAIEQTPNGQFVVRSTASAGTFYLGKP